MASGGWGWALALALGVGGGGAWARAGGAPADVPAPGEAAAPLVPPALAQDAPARYPLEALGEARPTGVVRLRLEVGADGRVARAELAEGVHPALDTAALEAARALVFRPATRGGVAVPVRLEFLYRFERPAERAAAEAPLPPVSVVGQVRQKGTRRPLPGATLVVDGAGAPLEAGPDGRFEARLAPGLHWLRVSAPGHRAAAFRETVRAGERLEVAYALEPQVVDPYETVVRADRTRTEVSRVSLEAQELREVPGTMGDPFRVVMLLPGVASLASGLAYPVVRGSQPAATGYFLDGVRVPLLYHLFLGPAVVHPDFVAGLDFYPGAPPPQYGRLLGGVVEGRLTRPRDDRVHGSAYADLINAGLFVEAPFATGTSVSVAGRYSYTPWLLALAATAGGLGASGQEAVLDFWDYQARVEQKVKGGGRLRLFAFGSSDTVGVRARSPDASTALQSIRFHRVDLRHVQPWGASELTFGVTAGLDRFGLEAGGAGPGEAQGLGLFQVDQWLGAARLLLTTPLARGLTLRAGADVEQVRAALELRVADEAGSVRFTEPVARATTRGTWAELVLERVRALTLALGLRLDGYHLSPGLDRLALEPRLSARWAPTDALTLRAGAGVYHQTPTTLISLPVVDAASLRLGLQEGVQLTAGVDWRARAGLDVSVDGYVNPLVRTYELTPFGNEAEPVPLTPVPPDGAPPDAPPTGAPSLDDVLGRVDAARLEARGLAYGLEVLVRHPLGGRWFGWVSYSLSRSVRRARYNVYDAHGVKVGEAQGELPFVFDQTHVLKLVLSHQLPGNVTLGAVLHLNSGRPETGNLTSQTHREGLDPEGAQDWIIQGRDRADRLPAFARLDLRASKRWAFDAFTLELYLDVLNATLSREVLGFQYQRALSGRLQKTPQGVPIALPLLGLKGQY